MTRLIVGPFNRVEGDLEVRLEIADGQVNDAFVTSTLYRGFEHILHGKSPQDALVFAPRICGICSVSQSTAAAAALADAQGVRVPLNGRLATNLVLATENVADHLTHFYMFFMPDFARPAYRNESWFEQIEKRFKAIKGTATRDMLPARAEFMHITGLLAGKWPHTMSIQPGGSTKSVAAHEKARLIALLGSFRSFLERILFGATLEEIIELETLDDLNGWLEKEAPLQSDFRSFLLLARELDLDAMGKSPGHFMSYGAYTFNDGPVFAQGVFAKGQVLPLDPQGVSEDLSHAWLEHRSAARHPFDGITIPDADAADGYTWCKAPRLNGQVMEVGAIARQLVDGNLLIRDMVTRKGGSVHTRVVSRLLEIARIVPLMEQWVGALRPGESFHAREPMPDEAQGVGLIEAARGALGHWLKVRNGRILNYQIVAPTTWNFSPRDADGVPGALEQALKGAQCREGEVDPVSVQHIVRSFDPCMVCTVH